MPAEPTITREQKASWTPMAGLFLAQVLMSFDTGCPTAGSGRGGGERTPTCLDLPGSAPRCGSAP